MPDTGDGYTWAVVPEKKYLFTKQLSKHSVRAYMELCRSVDVSFEALKEPMIGEREASRNVRMACPSASVSTLGEENTRLANELVHWKDQAHADMIAKEDAETEVKQLRRALNTIRNEVSRLQRPKAKWSSRARKFRNNALRSRRAVNKALSVLQTLRFEVPRLSIEQSTDRSM